MLLYQWLTEVSEKPDANKALMYRDTYLSWRGLSERVERRAKELSVIGIRPGQLVGLMLGNVPEFIIFSLAISKIGATLVPIDPATGVRELQQVLEVIPLRALITRPRGGTDPSSSLPPTPTRALFSVKPPIDTKNTSNIEPEVRKRLQGTLITCALYKRESPSFPFVPLVFISSDEWGRPKGILRTEENLIAQTESLRQTLDLQADDHILGLVPLHMPYSFEGSFLLALRYGTTLYLEEETSPIRILKLLREQEISIFPGLPKIYASLTKILTVCQKLTVKNPRFLSSESYLDPSMAEVFSDRFGPRILSLYRTTETGIISLDRDGASPFTVGTQAFGVEILLEGHPVEHEGTSSILVRSKSCSQSFISLPPLSSSVLSRPVFSMNEHGFFRTGDRGFFNEHNRLVLKGRDDDMVKVGEKRVMLHELVRCLKMHPKVLSAEAKASLYADHTFSLVASATCRQPCREEELLDHCARLLAPYKVPRKIEVTTKP